MKTIPNPFGRGDCFFCGADNPVGLKLTFQETDTEPPEIICRWVPSSVYTGFGKILHGGIQSGLFDEIMGWTSLHFTGQVGVTSSLRIDFVKPLFVGRTLEARCRIESSDGKRVNLNAEIRNSEGEICTKATGTYIMMDRGRFDVLVSDPSG
jgi:uncharacterized protein (TIGR00369 family)